MPMYNLYEYSENYLKALASLWQYYRHDTNDNIADSESTKSQINITGKIPTAGNTKDVKITAPL